jgi:hypothetical protein
MLEPKKKITIYSHGEIYEIDEDQLYEPFPKPNKDATSKDDTNDKKQLEDASRKKQGI